MRPNGLHHTIDEKITLLLNHLKDTDPDTVKFWLDQYKNIEPHQVGVIKASGKLLENNEETGEYHLDTLIDEMQILTQFMTMPLVLGGGPGYDKICEDAKKVNGLRITSEENMEKIYANAIENQTNMVKKLKAAGIDAVAIDPKHITVRKVDEVFDKSTQKYEDLGLVGEVTKIFEKQIVKALKNGQVPVLTHLGYDEKGQIYNVNATNFAAKLQTELGGLKLLLLGDTALKSKNKAGEDVVVSLIDSEEEYQELLDSGHVKSGMGLNIEVLWKAVKSLGPGHYGHLTTLKKKKNGTKGESIGLLEEMFGEGNGTKITIPVNIVAGNYHPNDKKKLTTLINGIFSQVGKKLKKGYFEHIQEKDPIIYLDHACKAGGIALKYTMHAGSESEKKIFTYLDKIFSHQDYKGLGIAKRVIQRALNDTGSAVWRVDLNNKKAMKKYDIIMQDFESKKEYNERISNIPSFSKVVGNYKIYGMGVEMPLQSSLATEIADIAPSMNKIGTLSKIMDYVKHPVQSTMEKLAA